MSQAYQTVYATKTSVGFPVLFTRSKLPSLVYAAIYGIRDNASVADMSQIHMPGKPHPGTESPALHFEPCGLPRRFLVMLYDGLVVIGLLMLAAALALVLGTGNQVAGKDLSYTLYLGTVWFLYLSWCWRHGGMTVGMRAWRVKLITNEGIPPSWTQCFIRFFCSWVSVLLLGAGFLWALSDYARRTWHDRLSKTRLVRVEKAA